MSVVWSDVVEEQASVQTGPACVVETMTAALDAQAEKELSDARQDRQDALLQARDACVKLYGDMLDVFRALEDAVKCVRESPGIPDGFPGLLDKLDEQMHDYVGGYDNTLGWYVNDLMGAIYLAQTSEKFLADVDAGNLVYMQYSDGNGEWIAK